LTQAAGVCESCGSEAPFLREDGKPYLEAHHVRPLSDKGPDTIDNVAACCPNCHRALHHAEDRLERRKELVSCVDRLNDY